MAGINKVILVGHLGRDPEIRQVNGDVKVASFSLATTESYKNRDGLRVDNTEWHNIVLWRGLAEVAERYLRKGNLVYIEGKIKTRSWEDEHGNKKYRTEIIADQMTMLGKKDDNAAVPPPSLPDDQPAASSGAAPEDPLGADSPDNDLPF